jgi:diguanylate cyclase
MKHADAISQRISRVLAIGATMVVSLCMLIVLAVTIYIGRQSTTARAQSTAQLVASSAEYALSFRDTRRGNELLGVFANVPEVIEIRVMLANGETLVALTNANASREALVWWRGVLQTLFNATAIEPVTSASDVLGYVEVTASETSAVRMGATLAIVSIALVLLFAAMGGPVARWLGTRLSSPLAALSSAIREVRRTRDYSLRMPTSELAEVQRLTEDFNALLEVIQSQSGELREFNQKLAKLAFYDNLTGAANRALVLDRLNQLLASRRDEAPRFALLAIDLDRFKQLNDRLGHDQGDKFLQVMTKNCLAEVRPSDTFARIGGDEFLVLLHGVRDLAGARIVAERLLLAVQAANSTVSNGPQCSASIGLAIYPTDSTQLDELLRYADRAMYAAKASGGNRVSYDGRTSVTRENSHLRSD